MSVKIFLTGFVAYFCITFLVSIIVSYLYGHFVHEFGSIDWVLSFRNGIIFAIILPLVNMINREKK